MPKKKQAEMEADDWEIADDVTVNRPVGIVLSIHFDRATLDRVLEAAESLDLTPVEFSRQAALLVANDPALQRRLARRAREVSETAGETSERPS